MISWRTLIPKLVWNKLFTKNRDNAYKFSASYKTAINCFWWLWCMKKIQKEKNIFQILIWKLESRAWKAICKNILYLVSVIFSLKINRFTVISKLNYLTLLYCFLFNKRVTKKINPNGKLLLANSKNVYSLQ